MPNFTVGRDASAVLIAPNGSTITLPALTQISEKPQYKQVTSEPLDLPPERRYLPAGHEMTLSFDRVDGAVDNYFSQIEAGWWANGTSDGGTAPTGAMFVYVTNPDGSQSTHNYQGLSFGLTDGGTFTVDQVVKMEISGFAGKKVTS